MATIVNCIGGTKLMDVFRKKLRSRIKANGTTIAGLARQLGMSRPYLHRILSGKVTPSLSQAEKIASAVGLTITIGRPRK